MKAWVISGTKNRRTDPHLVEQVEMPEPKPGRGEILLKVSMCGICHTELDEIEGRTPPPFYPLIPGHQVVGRVEETGPETGRFQKGDRVGMAWIFKACATCHHCRNGLENLCPEFMATGRDAHGGYAPYVKVHEDFAFPIPSNLADEAAAPLLCAGAIGHRSLELTGIQNGQVLGLTGFGASAHLVLKMARYLYPDTRVYVFARSAAQREFARSLGACWAGGTEDKPPEPLHAVIDTTPAWRPVIAALSSLAPGGRLVINAIRKEAGDQNDLASLNYEKHLWMEKEIKSVANVARNDVTQCLNLAAKIDLAPQTQLYGFNGANQALLDLVSGQSKGAKVLKVG